MITVNSYGQFVSKHYNSSTQWNIIIMFQFTFWGKYMDLALRALRMNRDMKVMGCKTTRLSWKLKCSLDLRVTTDLSDNSLLVLHEEWSIDITWRLIYRHIDFSSFCQTQIKIRLKISIYCILKQKLFLQYKSAVNKRSNCFVVVVWFSRERQ